MYNRDSCYLKIQMSSKYIPPHARDLPKSKPVSGSSSNSPISQRSDPEMINRRSGREISRSRRELKQSEFNIKQLASTPSPPLVIEPIQIPAAVDPPVIKPIRRNRWEPSRSEIELIQKLDDLQAESLDREFEEWIHHYKSVLKDMYKRCVDPDLCISYEDFIYAAYICTEVEFDSKKLKYSRPLI